MTQMIRLAAMDIDGTLLGRNKKISAYTKSILEEAGRSGIKLVIASGRAFQAIPKELTNIEGMEYVITSNGSSVFRLRDQKRIYGKDLAREHIQIVLKFYDDYFCPMEIFIRGVAYTSFDYYEHPENFGAGPSGVSYVRTTRTPVEDIRGFVNRHQDEIEGINLIVKDAELKAEIREKLAAFKDLYVTSSVPRYIEISHGDVSKQSALKWLAERLDISKEQIIAFGDGENDIEMIEYAGIGVAMGNAVDALKQAADRIGPEADEDGVAAVLGTFLSGFRGGM